MQLRQEILFNHKELEEIQNNMPKADGERPTLKDLLNYEPDKYITDAEAEMIRNVCKPEFINLLRKVFIPTIFDGAVPIENQGLDVYMQGFKWESVPAEHALPLILARQDVIKFILGGLTKLKSIAAQSVESPMEEALRRSKDSSK